MGLKRLKVKVKVESKSYEVAEIFGQPPPVGGPAASAAVSAESAECIICLTARRTHAIFPCRHLCLCAECAGMLREQTNRCPICRRAVEAVVPILGSEDERRDEEDEVEEDDRGGRVVRVDVSDRDREERRG